MYIVHTWGFGSYVGRIGPDSACFRGSPVFAGEGMQFESHLGHVFSLFRGLWAAECVQISFYGPLRGPFLLATGGGSFSLAWTAVLLCTPSWPGALGTA